MNSPLIGKSGVLCLAALACLLLPGCAKEADEEIGEQEIERAQAALAPFKEQLQAALVGSLEQGPENAIDVCRIEAPRIAASASTGGIRMGRTSHRLRNPDNALESWVEPILAAYLEDPEAAAPRAVRLDEGTIGYVEPIRLHHYCLKCHGPSVEPELTAKIRELYPEDRATDFRVGELRGVFWVTMPAGGGETG